MTPVIEASNDIEDEIVRCLFLKNEGQAVANKYLWCAYTIIHYKLTLDKNTVTFHLGHVCQFYIMENYITSQSLLGEVVCLLTLIVEQLTYASRRKHMTFKFMHWCMRYKCIPTLVLILSRYLEVEKLSHRWCLASDGKFDISYYSSTLSMTRWCENKLYTGEPLLCKRIVPYLKEGLI